MSVPLLTLAEAKTHLREVSTANDEDITAKTLEGSAIIVSYLKAQADPAWDDTTAPPEVKAGVKLLLSNLMENRGGEDEARRDEITWEAIARILVRRRDPALV
jgi:hypothetical protein